MSGGAYGACCGVIARGRRCYARGFERYGGRCREHSEVHVQVVEVRERDARARKKQRLERRLADRMAIRKTLEARRRKVEQDIQDLRTELAMLDGASANTIEVQA
jgi:ribosomal protein L44E